MNIAEIIDPSIADDIREQILRDVDERVGTVYEIDLIARDGRRIPLEVSTRAVLRDGVGFEVQGIAVPLGDSQPILPIHGNAMSG